MSQAESEELEALNLEVQRLSTNVANLRNAIGLISATLSRELGPAVVEQLLEMIE